MSKTKIKGIVPTIKEIVYGSESLSPIIQNQLYTQTFFQRFTNSYTFNVIGLRDLVRTGYIENPSGRAVIDKLLKAQREIKVEPYKEGEPLKNNKFKLDYEAISRNLYFAGTAYLWKKKIVGFTPILEVLNSLYVTEIIIGNTRTYEYEITQGKVIKLNEEDLIIIRYNDPLALDSRQGLSPLISARMPLDTLSEMYKLDYNLSKNQGVDVLISNNTDTSLDSGEYETLQEAFDAKFKGALKYGKRAVTGANVTVNQIGRTPKELALWDGYGIKTRDLCNVFSVDTAHFNDPQGKKFDNVTQAEANLYTNAVIPNVRLATENEEVLAFGKQYYGLDQLYVNTENIQALQEDFKIKAEKSKTITDTILTLNREVQKGDITKEIAIQILVSEWYFDEEEAGKYIQDKQERELINTENNGN